MATFTESFNKPDGAGLGPDLTWNAPDEGWQTVNQQVYLAIVTANNIVARAEHDTGSSDMYGEIVIPNFGTSSYGEAAVGARITEDRQNGYFVHYSTVGRVDSHRLKGGTYTRLNRPTSVNAYEFPETPRIVVDVNQPRGYQDCN